MRASEKCSNITFIRGWYLPLNGTIAIGVLHDLNVHFQGQTFSCCQKLHRRIARLARLRRVVALIFGNLSSNSQALKQLAGLWSAFMYRRQLVKVKK